MMIKWAFALGIWFCGIALLIHSGGVQSQPGANTVVGNVASGAADAGNPVKTGGKYNASPVTLANGNRGDLQLDVNGYVKVNVTNSLPNGQANMANSSPVAIASDQSAIPVTLTSTTITGTVAATQSGTWTVQPGNTPNTTSWLVKTNDGTNTQVLDPCQSAAKLYQPISQTTNTQLFAGTSAKKTYVCHIIVVGADAENISLVAGTGSVCATNTVAVIGATTAAAGPNLAANGGFSIGSGVASVAASTVNADNICLFQSGSGRVAGVMTYVAQ